VSREIVDRLFVYGTMRQGHAAPTPVAASVTRCASASTCALILAFPRGYPGYIERTGRGVGGVLWLSDLAATFGLLDAYEGEDFVRILRQARTETGEELWAWIYALADPEAVKLGTPIADGDWVRYRTELG
jgi:gamma-glutamylcyclotransferase (GGCT)/AIG2-like uncharacterized protein YtfP